MTISGLPAFDAAIHQANRWVHALDERLGLEDRHRAYRLLREVLQALRDWLPIEEGAQLSAQLPLLLKGVYYDQWRPTLVPVKVRSRDAFVDRIRSRLAPDVVPHLLDAISAVFELIGAEISRGEFEDVRQALPKDLRELAPLEPLVGGNW
jgi:uncharacterized protein (DUF2267 family)